MKCLLFNIYTIDNSTINNLFSRQKDFICFQGPTAIRQLASADVSATSFIIKWISPAPTNGFIEKYEVIVTWSSKSGFQDNTSDNNHEIRNYTSNVQMKFESLQPATKYSVKVNKIKMLSKFL